jgi:hypothetical protein
VARREAEGRVEVGNEMIRLEFDPRTSDTMYNYIWVRRPESGTAGQDRPWHTAEGRAGGQDRPWHTPPDTAVSPSPQPSPRGRGGESEGEGRQPGQWERVHNFGIDVGADRSDTGEPMNTIGMNLIMSREGRTVRVCYPNPLIEYRQFDDKIGTREKVAKYPDFTRAEMPGLVHAEASLEFVYEVDAERPSFVISGRVLTGKVHHVVYIIDALWTDNHALPTHEYVDGVGEFDVRTPEAARCKEVEVEGATFALFYRDDGDGVPFALLPQSPERARFCNYYDNSKCLHDFRAASLNQQFIPQEPPVTDCNDTGYIVSPREDGTLPGVRVAFFPELGWGRGGDGHQLRDQLVATIREWC